MEEEEEEEEGDGGETEESLDLDSDSDFMVEEEEEEGDGAETEESLDLDSDSDFMVVEEEEEEGDGGETEESVSELESMREGEPGETDSDSCSEIGHVLSDEPTDVDLEEDEEEEEEDSVAGTESIQEDESAEDGCIYEDHFLCECTRRRITGLETNSRSISEHVELDGDADSELVCDGMGESFSESQSVADEAADSEQEDVDASMVGSVAEESDSAGEYCAYEDHYLCDCPLRQIIGFDSDSNCGSDVEPTVTDEEGYSEQAEIDAHLDEWGDTLSTIFDTDMEESELGSESLHTEEPANVDLPDQNIVRLFDDSASELESTRGEEDLDGAYLSLLALELRRLTFALQGDDDVLISGSHRAACKFVVERLPSVLLVAEDRGEAGDDMICVVCDDEISLGEWATLLPCSHYYHGECILPWLKIRNTCPMCRHELPTDADYANDYFDLFSSV